VAGHDGYGVFAPLVVALLVLALINRE